MIKLLPMVVMLSLIMILVWSLLGIASERATAQGTEARLANLIRGLVEEEVTILIEFATPVAGQNAWFVPEDLYVDEEFAGRRLLGDVGDDYVCIEEVGVGLQTTYCIPYSNIADLSFNPPAS